MTKKWLPIDQAHVKKYLLNRLIQRGTFKNKILTRHLIILPKKITETKLFINKICNGKI